MEDGSQLRVALDQHIKTEYHQICFDPARRHTLLNLTAPASTHASLSHQPLSSQSLNKYIKDVYHRFNIEDPIRKELRLAQKGDKRNNRTQVKLSQLRSKFQQDNKDVLSTSVVQRGNRINNQMQASEQRDHMHSSRMKQIGYKTKEKMSFKARTQEDSSLLQDSSTGRQRRGMVSPRGQVSYFSTDDSMRERRGNWHYGEQSVLEYEHEEMYREYSHLRDVQKRPFQDIIEMLQTRLKRLQSDLREEITRKNTSEMQHTLSDLKQGVSNWLRDNKEDQLGPIRLALQNLCLGVHERVLKVKFYREMLSHARRQGSLPACFK